jgi:hypothetical protein
VVTELAQSNSNRLPFLDPKPNSEYTTRVGEEFNWTFTAKDPESDPITVSVAFRNSKLTPCKCSEVTTASDGTKEWKFKPNASMSG